MWTTRQFAGLPLHRQLAWANRYAENFGGIIKLGAIGDAIKVEFERPDRNTDAWEDMILLDEECHKEFAGEIAEDCDWDDDPLLTWLCPECGQCCCPACCPCRCDPVEPPELDSVPKPPPGPAGPPGPAS